mgnify:CR=1 FL=1
MNTIPSENQRLEFEIERREWENLFLKAILLARKNKLDELAEKLSQRWERLQEELKEIYS